MGRQTFFVIKKELKKNLELFFGGWWNRMKFADRLAGLVASHESKTCGHKHDSPNRNIAMGWFWTYPQVIDLRWKKHVCQWAQVAGFLPAAWEPVSSEFITKWLYTLQIETWIISSKLATVIFFCLHRVTLFFFSECQPPKFLVYFVFSVLNLFGSRGSTNFQAPPGGVKATGAVWDLGINKIRTRKNTYRL